MSAAFAALLIGFVTLLVGPANGAYAQPGTVTSVEFENQQFDDGSRQQINVEWAVEGVAENPVTVSIPLPAALRGYADRFTMLGAEGEDAGECVVTETSIDCTVDPAYATGHPLNMRGDFHFWADVRLSNDGTVEHEFDFGDASAVVTVNPRPDGTCPENCDFGGQGGWKGGWLTEGATDDIHWRVSVPAPADGIPAGSTIDVKDHLDADIYEIAEGPIVREARSLRLDGTGRWVPHYQVKTSGVTVSENNTRAVFDSVAGLPETELPQGHRAISGSIYLVDWRVKVRGGLQPNVEYTNRAEWSVEGRTPGSGSGKVVRQGGGGNVAGEHEAPPETGSIPAVKRIVNDGGVVLPDDLDFTLDYEWSADSDRGISAGSGSVQLPADGTRTVIDDLPIGAEVHFSEAAPVEVRGGVWETPVITPETVVVGEDPGVEVTVTNTLTATPVPPVTPGAEAPESGATIAKTGGSDLAPAAIAAALALMIAGGVALAAMRARRNG